MFTVSIGVFIFGLIAAIAGGAVGAAIGGNYAFVLTGFCVLASWGIFAATGSTFGLDYLAFGPFMGPHITFAAGAAAAIYARYANRFSDAKDVNSPLAGLGHPSILVVGGLFGIFGYLCQICISHIPWLGNHTDSVALTVVISAIVARFIFGGVPGGGLFKGSIFNMHRAVDAGRPFSERIKTGPGSHWLEWQERPKQFLTIGALFGIFSGGASLFLASNVGAYLTERGFSSSLAAQYANTFAFGISAVIILFLITNRNMPVQHHVTNIAGLAAVQFYPILMGSTFGKFNWVATGDWDSHAWLMAAAALVIAAIFGMVAAGVAEGFARLWYNRGSSHIDPPASAIWPCNTLVVVLASIFSQV